MEKIDLTEPPQMVLQKSGESDPISFDNILRKIDQNDELKMKKLDSYKYETLVSGKSRSSTKVREDKIGTLKTVAEKENGGCIS